MREIQWHIAGLALSKTYIKKQSRIPITDHITGCTPWSEKNTNKNPSQQCKHPTCIITHRSHQASRTIFIKAARRLLGHVPGPPGILSCCCSIHHLRVPKGFVKESQLSLPTHSSAVKVNYPLPMALPQPGMCW